MEEKISPTFPVKEKGDYYDIYAKVGLSETETGAESEGAECGDSDITEEIDRNKKVKMEIKDNDGYDGPQFPTDFVKEEKFSHTGDDTEQEMKFDENRSEDIMNEGNDGSFVTYDEPFGLPMYYEADKAKEEIKVSVIEGSRRNYKLYLDDYNYLYQSIKKGRTVAHNHYLKCLNGFDGGCLVTATLYPFKMTIIKRNDHNHGPDFDFIIRCNFLNAIKHRAATEPRTPIKTIYDEESIKFPDYTPEPFSKIQSTLYHIRKGVAVAQSLANATTAIPFDQNSIDSRETLPEPVEDVVEICKGNQYKINRDGRLHPFFVSSVVDSDDNNNLIFITPGWVKAKLRQTIILYVDAMIQAVLPPSWNQLIILRVPYHEQVMPVAYILMQSRTQLSYEYIFKELKRLMPGFNPLVCISDFHTELMDGLKTVFPSIAFSASCYYFCAAVWQKMESLNLQKSYMLNDVIKKGVKMIMALPLLTSEKIGEGLKVIEALTEGESPKAAKDMYPLFTYLKDFWLTTVSREKMSVFGSCFRTNYSVRTFSGRIASYFVEKPKIFVEFLEKLMMIEWNIYQWFENLRNGESTDELDEEFVQEDIVKNESAINQLSDQIFAGKMEVLTFLLRARHMSPIFSVDVSDATEEKRHLMSKNSYSKQLKNEKRKHGTGYPDESVRMCGRNGPFYSSFSQLPNGGDLMRKELEHGKEVNDKTKLILKDRGNEPPISLMTSHSVSETNSRTTSEMNSNSSLAPPLPPNDLSSIPPLPPSIPFNSY